jgi:hypothetical protein
VGRRKKLGPQESQGFIPGPPWPIRNSPVWRELRIEDLGLYLRMRARWNGREPSFKFSYADSLESNGHKVARSLFRLIRLGLIDKVDAGGLRHGETRAARYLLSDKWRAYDPARPGRFICEGGHVDRKWKACFTSDGTWKEGHDPEHAPGQKREVRFGKTLVNPGHGSCETRADMGFLDDDPQKQAVPEARSRMSVVKPVHAVISYHHREPRKAGISGPGDALQGSVLCPRTVEFLCERLAAGGTE